jgi:GNAT superfamily N-acetyltransferase
VIRRATPDDAPALAAVHVRAWRRAYADIVALEEMPTIYRRRERWDALLADGAEVYVFDQDSRIAGFAALDGNELRAIYVDPPAQGAGVGTALLAAAIDALRAGGHDEAFLWTFEANGLARAFYERHGWELVPGRQERLAPEVRYRRAL